MKHRFVMSTVAVLMIAANVLCVAGQEKDRAAASKGGGRDAKAVAAIRAVLDAQAEGWNRGDVDAYMDGYMRSPETVLVSGDSVTRGWQVVLDRYKKNYNSREKMGRLAFTEIEVTFSQYAAARDAGAHASGDKPGRSRSSSVAPLKARIIPDQPRRRISFEFEFRVRVQTACLNPKLETESKLHHVRYLVVIIGRNLDSQGARPRRGRRCGGFDYRRRARLARRDGAIERVGARREIEPLSTRQPISDAGGDLMRRVTRPRIRSSQALVLMIGSEPCIDFQRSGARRHQSTVSEHARD